VNGTITKSDVLGIIMSIFGNNLAQPGVTELFYSIEKNRYKILYLTARTICE
jgi:phosphatidate phosphatase LPIN